MTVDTQRVFIGRKLGHQRFELNGAGRVTYLTPETVVDDRVRTFLDEGECCAVLADVEPGPAGEVLATWPLESGIEAESR